MNRASTRMNPVSQISFNKRLFSIAVWCGIPLLLAEFIGLPPSSWLGAVFMSIPGVAVGVLVFACIEHATLKGKTQEAPPPPGSPEDTSGTDR